MSFDLDTLYFSSALSRAAYLLVFLVVALRQPRELCLWHWIGAIVASMVGSGVMVSVPATQWLTAGEALLVYTFYAASLVLSWTGLRLFNGREVRLPLALLAAFLPGLCYAAALGLVASARVALAVVIALCAAYAVAGTWEAVRRQPARRLWSAYVVSATLGAYAAMLALTFLMLVATDRPMRSAESGMMSMIVDQALGIVIYFGYIAMAKEQAVLTVESLADTDPLTGLANRRGLQAALRKLRGGAHGARGFGVLLADIDHFKSINDGYGHDGGDDILMAFSARLRETLSQGDIAARWGGEEFLVVRTGGDIHALHALAEHFRASIEERPFALRDGTTLRVTVSIGISGSSAGLSDFEPATRLADTALYDAKTGGRNRVSVAPLASAGAPAVSSVAAGPYRLAS